MKKTYVLDGTINGRRLKPRSFPSRKDAEEALSEILLDKGLQVEEDRFPKPHTEEFVCSYYTRFFITRSLA